MIEAVEIRFCSIDDKPIDISPAYQTLVAELGEETAQKWSYWGATPLPKLTIEDIMR